MITVGAALAPASAQAAVTVGQLAGPGVTPRACNIGTDASQGQVMWQDAVAGGASSVVPSDGVLVSFTVIGAGGQSQLLVARGGTEVARDVVAASALVDFAGVTTVTTPVRIPVLAGDRIGIAGWGTAVCFFTAAELTTEDRVHQNAVALPLPLAAGATPATPVLEQAWRTSIRAVLEPDADRDGFGDETQDACPTDGARQGECAADAQIGVTVAPGAIEIGQTTTMTVTVRNAAATPISSRSLSLSLPSGVEIATAPGACGGTTCTITGLAGGATATLPIVLRGTAAGQGNVGATLSSAGTPDPDTGNDAATAPLRVTAPVPAPTRAPALKLELRKRSLQTAIRSQGVLLAVRCDLACTARVTARLGRTTVGTARRSLAPGRTVLVRVVLTRRGLAALRGRRSARLAYTVVATGTTGLAATAKRTQTLRRAR